MSNSVSLFGLERFFYHGSIRRYTTLFGSLFTDLYISRKNDVMVEVPIKFGRGFRYAKADQTGLGRETDRVKFALPAIAYSLESFNEDTIRKGNPNLRIQHAGGDLTRKAQFNRIPYNFLFGLTIRTKTMGEMLQLVEQIVPAFNNKVTVRVVDNPELGDHVDVVISLDQTTPDDMDAANERGYVEWEMTFTLRGFLYARTDDIHIIREVRGELLVGEDEETAESNGVFSETNKGSSQDALLLMDGVGKSLDELGNVLSKKGGPE